MAIFDVQQIVESTRYTGGNFMQYVDSKKDKLLDIRTLLVPEVFVYGGYLRDRFSCEQYSKDIDIATDPTGWSALSKKLTANGWVLAQNPDGRSFTEGSSVKVYRYTHEDFEIAIEIVVPHPTVGIEQYYALSAYKRFLMTMDFIGEIDMTASGLAYNIGMGLIETNDDAYEHVCRKLIVRCNCKYYDKTRTEERIACLIEKGWYDVKV